MSWEFIRGGDESLLATSFRTCNGCEGGVDCPIDLFLMKIRNSPSKMNLVTLAKESGLTDIQMGIHLKAEGQYVEAQCRKPQSKIIVVHTNSEGLRKLSE